MMHGASIGEYGLPTALITPPALGWPEVDEQHLVFAVVDDPTKRVPALH